MLTDPPEYRRALKRERDREFQWRKTAQGAFESAFVHVDYEAVENLEFDRVRSWLSDDGAAEERMLAELDDDEGAFLSKYNRKKHCALNRLRRHMPEAVPVMLLIFRNGSNRKESIECLKRRITAKESRPGTRRKRSISHS